jgi:hypothetical protein
MRKRIPIYIGILVLAALACAGFFLLSHEQAAPVSTIPGGDVFVATGDVSTTTAVVSIASGSIQPPPNTKIYQSDAYHFSLYYPDDLAVSEHPIAGGSMVVLFQDKTSGDGFEIFVTPYGEPKITQQRFEMDEPSGVMTSPQNITIDGAAATEFLSANAAMGASREIWFLRGGYLYEVTTPQPLDSWLLSIMETWQFT